MVIQFVGEMTDEEYVLWKSKFPAFLSDFYEFRKQAGQAEEESFEETAVSACWGRTPNPVNSPAGRRIWSDKRKGGEIVNTCPPSCFGILFDQ